MVEEMFLATLSRLPTPEESAELVERLDRARDRGAADGRATAEDVMWALLNHQEFLFQH
jgi:hypothetical protein